MTSGLFEKHTLHYSSPFWSSFYFDFGCSIFVRSLIYLGFGHCLFWHSTCWLLNLLHGQR